MAFYLSPGVYSREKDVSDIVPGVATTSAAIVGWSPQGAANQRVLITTPGQFVAEFGSPVPGNPFHYSALAYLQRGNSLQCVRAITSDTLASGAKIAFVGDHATTSAPLNTGVWPCTTSSVDPDDLEEGGGTPVTRDDLFYVFAKNPGDWGNNLGVAVTPADPSVSVENGVAIPASSFGDSSAYQFNIEVWLKDSNNSWNRVETWTVSRKHKLDGYGRQLYFKDRINGSSKYIVVDDSDQADTVMPAACGQGDDPADDLIKLAAGADGAYDSAGYRSNVLGVSGGSPVAGQTATGAATSVGWELFANPESSDVRVLIQGGTYGTYSGTSNAALKTLHIRLNDIAASRKDCIAVIDMPDSIATSATPVEDMLAYRSALDINSSYAAIYGPYLSIQDSINDVILAVPPSGFVAGQYAYNDLQADPWYAPAGFNRGQLSVLGVSYVFKNYSASGASGERDSLYAAGINPIQQWEGEGIALWGQKTLQRKPSALDRINVRRSLIVIEKSVTVFLRQFLFEPNNEITRTRVSSGIDGYLSMLAGRGAFQTEVDGGFHVECSNRNNTQEIIDRNELRVDIYIKPSRSAEFILLTTVITRSGASFTELVTQGLAA